MRKFKGLLLALILAVGTLLADSADQEQHTPYPPEWSGEAKSAPVKLVGIDNYKNEFKKLESLKGEEHQTLFLSLLDPILRDNPTWSEGWLLRSALRMTAPGSPDVDVALSEINTAISVFPSTKLKSKTNTLSECYSTRALIHFIKHNYKACLDDLEASYKDDYSQAHSVFYRATEPGAKPESKFSWGVDILDQLEEKFPHDYRVQIVQGLYYFARASGKENRRYGYQALQHFKSASKMHPKSPIPIYYMGKTEFIIGLYAPGSTSNSEFRKLKEKVINIYALAISKDKSFWPAYEERAGLFDSKKNRSDAIRDFRMVAKLRPNKAKAHSEGAFLEIQQGNYLAGIWMLDEAIKLHDPWDYNLKHLYLRRAEARSSLGQFREAIADYSNAIRIVLGSYGAAENISIVRTLYPEFKDYTDSGFYLLYYKQFQADYDYEYFLSKLDSNKNQTPYGLYEMFEQRYLLYLKFNQFRLAALDYRRAKSLEQGNQAPNRWVKYRVYNNDIHYIDIESIELPSNGKGRVWLKKVTKKEEVLAPIEIDVTRRMVRTGESVVYNQKGEVTGNVGESKWSGIVPGSLAEDILRGFIAE